MRGAQSEQPHVELSSRYEGRQELLQSVSIQWAYLRMQQGLSTSGGFFSAEWQFYPSPSAAPWVQWLCPASAQGLTSGAFLRIHIEVGRRTGREITPHSQAYFVTHTAKCTDSQAVVNSSLYFIIYEGWCLEETWRTGGTWDSSLKLA